MAPQGRPGTVGDIASGRADPSSHAARRNARRRLPRRRAGHPRRERPRRQM